MAAFETVYLTYVAAEDKFARGNDGVTHYTRVTHVPSGGPGQWVQIRLSYCTETTVSEDQEVDASTNLVTCLHCRGAYG